jgi:ABC-type amino acid transport system permease subunit
VADLTHIADYIQSRTYRAFETYMVTAAIYLGLAIMLRRFLMWTGQMLFAGRIR